MLFLQLCCVQGFAEKDIYVCESRYTPRIRTFKKIKHWSVPRNHSVRVIARAEALTPVRVASVFADQRRSASPAPPPSSLEVAGLNDDDVLDKTRQVVELPQPGGGAAGGEDCAAVTGCRYYEQLKVDAGWFKIGRICSSYFVAN